MKTAFTLFVIIICFSVSVQASECVILLHGLGRSHQSFSKMEKSLINEGFIVVNDSYSSRKQNIEKLAFDIIPASIEKCAENQSIHIVTHSLGGILVRQYLSEKSLPNLGRVVMLAPPNKGSEVTDKLRDNFIYKVVNGPAGQELGTDSSSVPRLLGPVDFELGIIAGTRTVNPILSIMLPNPDDGKVTVESTKIEGMTDHLVISASHTFIMRKDETIDQVIYYLRNGAFQKY